MVRVIQAEAIIKGKDATGPAFDRVSRRLKGLIATANQANRSVAGAAMRVKGASAAVAGVVGQRGSSRGGGFPTIIPPIGLGALGPAAAMYGGVRAVKRFGETDMALTRIGLTADATRAEIDKLGTSVRDLAYESGKSFNEVSGGLESLVAGGMNLPEAMPALPAIAKTAQAAGAEVKDMATTTLALSQSLGISTSKMQTAFDILVTAGKAGKFELKDMARYMASIAPAAAAIGLKGEEGLQRIVAMLQTVRAGTGTTEEAAASVANIFAKMESQQTVARFAKFGVDLRKEMAKARKEGRDLLSVFVDLTDKALKGDLSKIPQLFSDMELARGMRALMAFKDVFADVMNRVKSSAGSAMKDFDEVMKRPQVAVDRLSESFDRLKESAGKMLDAIGASTAMKKVSEVFDEAADYYNKPEAERACIQAEKRRRAVLDPHIREVEEKIRQREEAERQQTEPSFWQKVWHGKTKLAPLDERLRDDPLLRELRLRLFDLKSKRDSVSPDDLPSILTDKEREMIEEVDRERRRGEALSGMTPENSRARGKRGTGVPLPTPDPRKRPAVGFIDNFMDLPAPPAKWSDDAHMLTPGAGTVQLTGSAEVKGETKVTVEVQVAPTSELIKAAANSKSVTARLSGTFDTNGPGSLGKSSPDAAAPGRNW